MKLQKKQYLHAIENPRQIELPLVELIWQEEL